MHWILAATNSVPHHKVLDIGAHSDDGACEIAPQDPVRNREVGLRQFEIARIESYSLCSHTELIGLECGY